MPAFAAAGAAFLLAVLWFDLMFDVQVRGQKSGTLPDATLSSIAAYYKRVTTDARPMNMLVSAAMLATLIAVIAELTIVRVPLFIAAASLVLVVSSIGLAARAPCPTPSDSAVKQTHRTCSRVSPGKFTAIIAIASRPCQPFSLCSFTAWPDQAA